MQKYGIKFLKHDGLEVAAEYVVTDCRGTEVSVIPDETTGEVDRSKLTVNKYVPGPIGYTTLFNGTIPQFPRTGGRS